MNALSLTALQQVSVQTAGSKARHLGAMLAQGLPVPPGFVVTTDAFQAFLRANPDVQTEADFLSAPLPAVIAEEIAAQFSALQEQGVTVVAVRSSSALEDLNHASFAGQYETYLNVCSLDSVLLHIKRCWASYFSPAVQHYAKQHQICLDSLAMGVLVQGMVEADVSGVIFSKHPVTCDPDEIVINASYGLGEAVVSGLVTPDSFIVSKRTGEICKELGLKEVKILPAATGTMTVETSAAEQEVFCLGDGHIEDLAALTCRVEALHGRPVDLEFAIQAGTVYLLQVRPITT
ncbi:pyruvate phosphate dikinase-like enzyme [Tumebacillus sp. BK434]|uniref:PEP/pyruvate-binding domain-containing protein n=1 Tax=Tumebacillus sp. BK434 TaxID=2512169 RepID=UPI001052C6F4|nr:PEP/pyruvate-binding domain-containing protein [Tumebacillus sp. BK434]TCP57901.1 pyruvate phosphate dikinase-like enzyme [Tumebacillus sp. BK434]